MKKHQVMNFRLLSAFVFGLCFLSGAGAHAESPAGPSAPSVPSIPSIQGSEVISKEYWVRVPATRFTCQEEASFLARRFTEATHIPVKTSVCRGVVRAKFDGVSVNLYSLLLNFDLKDKVDLYRASIGGYSDAFQADTKLGGYSKYEECLDQIPTQTDLFARNTGLSVAAVYCEPLNYLGTNQYILNIEGFGQPKARLFLFNLNSNPFNDGFDADLQNEVLGFLKSFGAEIVRTIGGVSYYYIKDSIDFNQFTFATFKNDKECAEQIEVATSILNVLGSSRSIVRCVTQSGPRGFALYSLSGGGRVFINENRSFTNYYSFTECMEDRARVLSHSANEEALAGAICKEDSMTSGIYKMIVYSR